MKTKHYIGIIKLVKIKTQGELELTTGGSSKGLLSEVGVRITGDFPSGGPLAGLLSMA